MYTEKTVWSDLSKNYMSTMNIQRTDKNPRKSIGVSGITFTVHDDL